MGLHFPLHCLNFALERVELNHVLFVVDFLPVVLECHLESHLWIGALITLAG